MRSAGTGIFQYLSQFPTLVADKNDRRYGSLERLHHVVQAFLPAVTQVFQPAWSAVRYGRLERCPALT